MRFKHLVGARSALTVSVVAVALAAAAPAQAAPDENASVAGKVSSYFAHQQSRDELSQTVIAARKAGDRPLEYGKVTFTDLIVSSGICTPAICGGEN